MSISPPFVIGEFWEKIRFAGRPEFRLLQYRRQSMDGAGNVLSSSGGSPKWVADVVTANGRHNADMDVQAMLKLLDGRNAAFFAYDTRKPYPIYDPDGTVLGSAAVKVKSKGSNNRSLALKGLPPFYEVTATDMISINYAGSKYALLELMEGATADIDGNTEEFEVQPFLSTGIQVNDPVDLIKPRAKFNMVAGSYKPQDGQGNQSSGISFSMISIP